MADANYLGLVYDEAGPNGRQALVVKDGGEVEFPVTVQSTTSGTISNFGITTIGTTIQSQYTLADPDRAGLVKTIVNTVHGATTVVQVVSCASANVLTNTVGGATTVQKYRKVTFSGPGAVQLMSLSTSHWSLVFQSPYTGNIAVSS